MFEYALKELVNYKKQFIGFLLSFLLLNFIIDYLNLPINQMYDQYGIGLVLINITLSVIMSLISALSLTLSIINMKIKNTETKSSNLNFFSLIFSIMTYGCTSCVISFLAIFNISYSVMVLPMAGLAYKFIALIIIIAGLIFTRYEINKPCKIKA